jgi:hypothetical protein
MKTNHQLIRTALVAVVVLALLVSVRNVCAQGTAGFTYQGRLNDGTNRANGSYDFVFTLYNSPSGGTPVGAGPVTNLMVGVNNGLFTTPVGFIDPTNWIVGFIDPTNWMQTSAPYLEIGVRTNGGGTFTTLSPRQQVTPTPYAIVANSASTLLGTLSAAQLSGTVPLAQLPPGLVTNNETGVTLSDVTVSGNLTLPATTATIYSGDSTLLSYSSGLGNFFAGPDAGNLTMSGGDNTGIGAGALHSDTSGGDNTASGVGALGFNTSGEFNTANGDWALASNTNGSGNTANGEGALFYNTSGNNNTADGSIALYYNTSGSDNTANGFEALYSNTTGSDNTANGEGALFCNKTGSDNTADGAWALCNNTSGSDNTANGYQALYSNTSGSDNAANGSGALYCNTSGSDNAANGSGALYCNTSGWYNTANGFQALYCNTNGNCNTANGCEALSFNTTGSGNTANGTEALLNNTSGYYNTASGYWALQNNTSGSNNIALGYCAGVNITNGSYNIDIGNEGTSTDNAIIRIGTQGTQTNTFIAGIYGATSSSGLAVYVNSDGQLGTSTSSRRFKQDIQPMGDASDVLLALRPVTFRYKPEIDPQGIPQFGLVAEEVEQVDPNLIVRDKDGKPYSVRYEQVNAMLLNEFLKEHRKVEQLESRLQKLEQLLNAKNGGGQ